MHNSSTVCYYYYLAFVRIDSTGNLNFAIRKILPLLVSVLILTAMQFPFSIVSDNSAGIPAVISTETQSVQSTNVNYKRTYRNV